MNLQIDDYSPYPGFYDLRDFTLPKKLFKKLWRVQDMLAHMRDRAEYFKKWHPGQWERAKELSGQYQQRLFKYKEEPHDPKKST